MAANTIPHIFKNVPLCVRVRICRMLYISITKISRICRIKPGFKTERLLPAADFFHIVMMDNNLLNTIAFVNLTVLDFVEFRSHFTFEIC